MPRLRIVDDQTPEPSLKFPIEHARGSLDVNDQHGNAEDVLDALENVSRRIDDLARELNCLGWFDDDDRPRAA